MSKPLIHGSRQRGATLVELMVTVSIAVILMGIAAPSMMQAMARQELRAVRDELAVALQLSEIESARRGVPVLLARQTGCGVALFGAGDWSCGYVLFADDNRNGFQDNTATEPSIRVVAGERRVQLMHTNGGADVIQMNPWGRVTGGEQRFVLSSLSRPGTNHTVCLGTGGNIRDFQGAVGCP